MSRAHDEEGAVLLIVAFSLVALLGMVVLVVDLGAVLVERRTMVQTTDAAALAAAQSFAVEEALVGADEAPAIGQADAFAASNEPDAIRDLFAATALGLAGGEVTVAYHAIQKLFFAPILGLDDSSPVAARATAIWGPAGAAVPAPIEFSSDPSTGQIPCVGEAIGTTCTHWYDNSVTHDLTDMSNWGFMNLHTWGIDPGGNCPNAGASQIAGWITGTSDLLPLNPGGPTYACVASGFQVPSWYDALLSQVGQIKYFPINDPSQMILSPSGKAKYALVGFAALRITDVLRGNDPAAVGTPGTSGSCSGTHSFAAPDPVTGDPDLYDVDLLGCYAEPPADITNLKLSVKKKEKGEPGPPQEVVFELGVDYLWDADTHEITWLGEAEEDVLIEFDWSNPGTPGVCGLRDSDPNGVCMVTTFEGLQLGGAEPCPECEDFGLRAVRLKE